MVGGKVLTLVQVEVGGEVVGAETCVCCEEESKMWGGWATTALHHALLVIGEGRSLSLAL